MPFIESVSRQWRARLRTPAGHGRSGWIAWLIVALVSVQMWGLQHEIFHARGLSGLAQGAAAAGLADSRALVDSRDSPLATAAASGTPAPHVGTGHLHHHCHLFEGATLAAAMAVAVLQWHGGTVAANASQRITGRSHASALQLPFDSRAPPVVV